MNRLCWCRAPIKRFTWKFLTWICVRCGGHGEESSHG